MRRIFAIGETVYDIIFKEDRFQAARAGGSMLNASVSMGRLKLPVNFVSEFGNDKIGSVISDFLFKNNVNDHYVFKYDQGRTPLSLAFLDENSDAEYTFYRLFPEKRFDIAIPEFNLDDIVLFGSFFSITREIRQQLVSLLDKAAESGALIIYDPNFRKSHAHELGDLKDFIFQNISYAHIVRGSDEDFYNIFRSYNADDSWKMLKRHGCDKLLYTANRKGVSLRTPHLKNDYQVNNITPLSTIGAGDNFNAGVVSSIYNQNIPLKEIENLEKSKWDEIVGTAIAFATHTCLSYDNYISSEFAEQYLTEKYPG